MCVCPRGGECHHLGTAFCQEEGQLLPQHGLQTCCCYIRVMQNIPNPQLFLATTPLPPTTLPFLQSDRERTSS
jgi:hypothetical protein